MVNVSPPQIVAGVVPVLVGEVFIVAVMATLVEIHVPFTAST